MSVAFRRESDEEHKEPKFEVPIPPGPNLVTARGLARIAARIEALEAATLDDEGKRDLRYWRARLVTARVARPPPGDEAGFGSRVAYRLGGAARAADIVGSDEADPAAGRIAFTAPLARALIGAGPGDRVAFQGIDDAIEILAVGPIPDSAP